MVGVMAELNLKLHIILTINFSRHTSWLMATILDSTGLKVNVPQSQNWLVETNIFPSHLRRDSPWTGVRGLGRHESPRGVRWLVLQKGRPRSDEQ